MSGSRSKTDAVEPCRQPCEACPWRKENHGKPHPGGFYTKTNLTRLWNQIRRGGLPQSCHRTDPRHPDHKAPPNAKPQECPGSVILVLREIESMLVGRLLDTPGIVAYHARRKKGLTKKGILYWAVSRITLGKVPFMGDTPLPPVDLQDKRIALPAYLEG